MTTPGRRTTRIRRFVQDRLCDRVSSTRQRAGLHRRLRDLRRPHLTQVVRRASADLPDPDAEIAETPGGTEFLRERWFRFQGELIFIPSSTRQRGSRPKKFSARRSRRRTSTTSMPGAADSAIRSSDPASTVPFRARFRVLDASAQPFTDPVTQGEQGTLRPPGPGYSLHTPCRPPRPPCIRPDALRMRSAAKPRNRGLRDLPWFPQG